MRFWEKSREPVIQIIANNTIFLFMVQTVLADHDWRKRDAIKTKAIETTYIASIAFVNFYLVLL